MAGPWDDYESAPQAMPWEEYQAPDVADAPPIEAPDTLRSRIQSDIQERLQAQQEIKAMQERGELGEGLRGDIASGLMQAGKVGAGSILDVVGQTAMAGLGEAERRFVPEGVKESVIGTAKEAAEIPVISGALKGAGVLAKRAADLYGEYKEEHPVGAMALESAANIAALAPAPRATKGLIPETRVGKTGQKLIEESKKVKSKYAPVTANQMRKKARRSYKLADQKGGVAGSGVMDDFLDDVSKMKPSSEAVVKARGGKREPFEDMIDELSALRGDKLSLDDVQGLDEMLSNRIDDFVEFGTVKKKGYKLQEIQNKFRQHIDEAVSGGDVTKFEGGAEGFKAFKEGQRLWHKARKLDDIERIIMRAEFSDNQATVIKNGFKTLLTKKGGTRGYSKAEIELMKKAAKTGNTSDLLKTFGSRLMPIGTAVTADPVVAAGVYAGAKISRDTAAMAQLSKANKVARLIATDTAKKAPYISTAGRESVGNMLKALDKAMRIETKPGLLQKMRVDRALLLQLLSEDEQTRQEAEE